MPAIQHRSFTVHIPYPADAQPVEARLTEMGFKLRSTDHWRTTDQYLVTYGRDTDADSQGAMQYLCNVFATPCLAVSQFFDTYGRSSSDKLSPSNSVAAQPAAPANPPNFVVDMGEGGNAILSEMVQRACFKAGIGWSMSTVDALYTDHRFIHVDRKGFASLGWSDDSPDRDCKCVYSASTQMGEIVRLLSTPVQPPPPPKPPAPVGPTIHGYTGSYKKGGQTITFGCADISLEMLRQVNSFQRVGNRLVDIVTLSSGKTLTREQITDIFVYVAAVDAYQS